MDEQQDPTGARKKDHPTPIGALSTSQNKQLKREFFNRIDPLLPFATAVALST
ncbi:MAG: hypothetical protein M3436_15610 [Pseudomonadota bacterium]|nr:hypothetical protein [Pseudomonadota bacterium]